MKHFLLSLFFGGLLVSPGIADTLIFSPGAVFTGTNLYLPDGSSLVYELDPDWASGVAIFQNVTIEEGFTFDFDLDLSEFTVNQLQTNLLVQADELLVEVDGVATHINGGDVASVTDLEEYVENGLSGRSLVESDLYAQGDNVLIAYSRLRLADVAGFESGSMMEAVADEIDAAAGNDAAATVQLNMLDAMSGTEQYSELSQLYTYTMPNYEHQRVIWSALDVVGSRSVSFKTARRLPLNDESNDPDGAFAPHLQDQPLRAWGKAYGSVGSMMEKNQFPMFEQEIAGMLLGVDKAFGSLLVGAAGGFGTSRIDSADGDSSDAYLGYGVLYSMLNGDDWFCSAYLSYGEGRADKASGTSFELDGDIAFSSASCYLGLGREFNADQDTMVVVPEIGVLASIYNQDGYSETSTNALVRNVEDYERWSLRPTAGVTISWPYEDVSFRCEPRMRAFWIGELNHGADSLDYTLGTGTDHHAAQVPGTEVHTFNFGAGAAFIKDNGWEFSGDLDTFLGEYYSSFMLSAKVGYMF